MTHGAVRAGIYCRLSLARTGDTTKVEDQERICRGLAEQRGWTIPADCGYPQPNGAYVDNNASAWKKNRKRPGWDLMLDDVEAGKISAIVVYHGDRLIRRPEDLGDLLKLARTRGTRLASPTGERDLGNADDEFVLWIEAAMANRESGNLSRRKRTEYDRLRLQGRTRPGGGGGRCFGFETDGITHRPDEAGAIRDAAAAILRGMSLGKIVADLRDAGFRTTAGNELRQSSFRRTLLSPRMAGLMPDGARAAWDPVIERADWEMLRAALDANSANSQAGRGALHLLSGIARCGSCDRPLWAALKGATQYRCTRPEGCGRVHRNRVLLDAYVTRRTVNRLNHPATPAGKIPEAPGLAAEFAALAGARAEIETAMADHTRGRLPLLLARLDSLDSRLAELREVAAGDAAARLRGTHAGITEKEFNALPLQVRRSLVAACFTVRVLPASKRGPGFHTEDVEMTPL